MEQKISSTTLSSRGQVVIPENIRKSMDLQEGTTFLVFNEEDVVFLKLMRPPSRKSISHILKLARKQARAAGMTKKDLKKAIAAARGE